MISPIFRARIEHGSLALSRAGNRRSLSVNQTYRAERSGVSFRASSPTEGNIYYRYARKLFAHLRQEALVGPEIVDVKPIESGNPGARLLLWLPAETFTAIDPEGRVLGTLKGMQVTGEDHALSMIMPVAAQFQMALDSLDLRELEAFANANRLRLDFVYDKFFLAAVGVTSKSNPAYQGMYFMIELSQNKDIPAVETLESVPIETAFSMIQRDSSKLAALYAEKNAEASTHFEAFRQARGLPQIYGQYDFLNQRWWLN